MSLNVERCSGHHLLTIQPEAVGERLGTEELHPLRRTVPNGPDTQLQVSVAERLRRQQEEGEKPAPLLEE